MRLLGLVQQIVIRDRKSLQPLLQPLWSARSGVGNRERQLGQPWRRAIACYSFASMKLAASHIASTSGAGDRIRGLRAVVMVAAGAGFFGTCLLTVATARAQK